MGSQFQTDDEFQRALRDRILVPEFYGKRMNGGRFVLMDKGRLCDFVQRRLAVDSIVQARDGSAVGIEEKIVRWKGRAYSAMCLETWSCTVPGREKTGWMEYGQADYLLYCYAQPCPNQLLCYLVEFQPLKEWFTPQKKRWPETITRQINRTKCRVVPINEICGAVPSYRFTLSVRDAHA